MNWLDIVLLVLVLGSAVLSFSKGLSREIVRMASAVGALVLGLWLYGTAGTYVQPYVSSKSMANFCGFLLVFGGVLLLGAFVGLVLNRILKGVGLSFVDRLLGAVFGAARGFLIAAALVLAVMAFAPGGNRGSPPNAVVHSKFSPYVMDGARVVSYFAPYELKAGFRKSYEQVKEMWRGALKKGIRERNTEHERAI